MSESPKFNWVLPAPNARKEILALWRGTDEASSDWVHPDSAKSINQVISTVLKNLKLDRRRSEAEIQKAWKHLVDPNVAAHAHPVGYAKGTVFISVDSSVWLSEIVRYRRQEILQRLQNTFGADFIAKLSFRVG